MGTSRGKLSLCRQSTDFPGYLTFAGDFPDRQKGLPGAKKGTSEGVLGDFRGRIRPAYKEVKKYKYFKT
jgi:hypothetical protein